MTEETSSPRIRRESLDHWQFLKRERMSQIIDYLRSMGEVDRTRFIGGLCVQGFQGYTVVRYLKELADAGFIRITDDRICWIDEEGQGE